MDDITMRLVGGGGGVSLALLVNILRRSNNRVAGYIEAYRLVNNAPVNSPRRAGREAEYLHILNRSISYRYLGRV